MIGQAVRWFGVAAMVVVVALAGCGQSASQGGREEAVMATTARAAQGPASAAEQCAVTVASLLYEEAGIIENGGVDTVTADALGYGADSAVYRTYMAAMPTLGDDLDEDGQDVTDALNSVVPQIKTGCEDPAG